MRGIALGEIAVAKEGMCCATVGATKEIASVRIVEFKLVVKPRACARPRAVRLRAPACRSGPRAAHGVEAPLIGHTLNRLLGCSMLLDARALWQPCVELPL